jgi:hypothetical protein
MRVKGALAEQRLRAGTGATSERGADASAQKRYFAFVNCETDNVDVVTPIADNIMLTAIAHLSRHHEGMLFTPMHLGSQEYLYEVYSSPSFLVEQLQRIADGQPPENESDRFLLRDVASDDIKTIIKLIRRWGMLIGKLTVALPKAPPVPVRLPKRRSRYASVLKPRRNRRQPDKTPESE